jgi:integrase
MAHVDDRWYVVRDGSKVPSSRHGKGRRWQATYRVGGREVTRSFDLKADADAFLVTVGSEQLRGEYIDRTDRRTVAEYAREYAATRLHGPRTTKRVDSLIRTHIEGTPLGQRRLADVRPSEVQAWVTGRAKVLAPLTVRNLVGLLRSIFAAAARDRLIGSSPCVGLSLPSTRRERLVPLTVAEVRQLADAMQPRNKTMVITQAGLGLRLGELLALRVEDINFLRRTVRIEWQVAPDAPVRCAPKTPTSRRTIPLPAFVGEALSEHIREFPPAADGTVFTNPAGRLYSRGWGAQTFARAVKRAGLPPSTTTHSLRHHYASVLLQAGESVVCVAERLGHENATLVLTTYGHLLPDSEDRTRRALDDAWSAPAATDQPRTEEQR